MKRTRPQKAGTSAVDKRNHTPPQDLFPETLTLVSHTVGSIGGTVSDESPRVAPNHPNITPAQYAQVCMLAACIAGV